MQIRLIKRTLLIVVVLLILFSCSEERPILVDFSKRSDIPLRQHKTVTIKYAYLPQYSHIVSYQRHNPLIEYLKSETNLQIEQVFPETFNEHIKMLGEGKIDISYSNPVAYVEMANRYGARAFAMIVEPDGKADFRGQIIARSDNQDIKSIKDCKGKRWIAVDPYSAGGYIFPLGHFIKNGINKKDFAEIAFAQGHGKSEKVVLAVHAGKYDCGSVREGTLEIVKDKINLADIKILANTDAYPGWVFAARKGLDSSVVDAIRDAMIKLDENNPKHQQILKAANIKAIISADDKDFDSIRQLMKRVGSEL
ncbi:MAG: phosphate/phosphite/phosphonate ABC transporter substrate-binding protein [Thermodesulfovibrionales bacterium]|nr:phosphate/phosphite/phosphonate ABC transporter substrate-binding protein [Thermodesulfovibrionales bacterium]